MTETRLRCRAGFREPDLRSLEVKISFIKRKATIVKFLKIFELVVTQRLDCQPTNLKPVGFESCQVLGSFLTSK